MKLPNELTQLITELAHMPGVGEKSAFRLAMDMIKWSSEERERLAQAIINIREIRTCRDCFNFATKELCLICADSERDRETLCVVDSISDLLAFERSGRFTGRYFVLGGTLNPLKGIGPKDLHIPELLELIKKHDTKCIILALAHTLEGDATCSYIKQILENICRIERIAFGIPMGANLDYLDPLTLGAALDNRKKL